MQGTTQQPSVPLDDPVRAERADIYDVGVVQQVLPELEVGIDGYYKKAKSDRKRGSLQAYANLA